MNNELKWRLIDSGYSDASYNMALDEAIAISVRDGKSPPILRIYGWESPSVSLGSFQNIADIDFNYCLENNIAVVRRPTGGRGILHSDELTYSFCARNKGEFSGGLLETYRLLGSAFRSAMEEAGLKVSIKPERESGRNLIRSPLCFKSTSFGEISFNGKKLIGSAQKRWNDGFLQQGSIPYSIDHEKINLIFKSVSGYRGGGREKWCVDSSLQGIRDLLHDFDHEMFKKRIKEAFEKVFNITFADCQPFHKEHETALVLMKEKYLNPLWTQGERKNILCCNKT
jgi:lipoate-protein ligase A